jgi:hypothetical protein
MALALCFSSRSIGSRQICRLMQSIMGTVYNDEVVASMTQIEGTRWRAARSFASTPAGPMRLRLLTCNSSELPPLPDQHGSTSSGSGELRERLAIHPDRPPRASISCWQCATIGYEANPAASHDAHPLPVTSPPSSTTSTHQAPRPGSFMCAEAEWEDALRREKQYISH